MPTKKRIQYRYTPTGQRSLLIDPDGGRFTYTYDSLKRLTQVINPQAAGGTVERAFIRVPLDGFAASGSAENARE